MYEKNPNFEKYAKVNAVTSYFQVYEVYHSLIRNGYSEEDIEDFFEFLQNLCIDLDFDWIPQSVKFRKENKKRELSYADCLGYVIARELNIRFLTGDKEFEDLPNVEFVKK
ncbi:hypothetical protein A3K73_01065 [Candidatus Pacearchaeota archaeon RBG_13_36_9]|nr:MAG: hypothetical protein A3K73_01065 [Candidatus Pacearchaeota archaeon RBG_13_36_9]